MLKKLNAMRNNVSSTKKGFTLIEILVVILIIGILFVLLIPRIDGATHKSREAGVKTDFRSFQVAMESVAREHSGLGAKAVTDAATEKEYLNGYLDEALKFDDDNKSTELDPWNKEYVLYQSLKTDSNDGVMAVFSGGKDGVLDSTVVNAAAADFVAPTATDDDYMVKVTNVDGVITTASEGFTSNIQ